MLSRRLVFIGAVCGVVGIHYCGSSRAAWWDVNGSAAGSSSNTLADGIWSSSNFNWSSGSTGTTSTTGWSSGGTASFSAGSNATGAYTVTVFGTQNLVGMTVEEGTITQSGGTLNFGATADAPINILGGATWNESATGVLTGTGGIRKTGGGTLILRGTNTFSKSGSGDRPYLTVAVGTVDFAADANLGAVPSSINAYAVTLDGATLRFGGETSGSIDPNRGVRIGSSGGTIEVSNPVQLQMDSSGISALSLNGSGTLTKTGVGRLAFQGTQKSFSGKYMITGGSVSAVNDTSFGPVPTPSAVADYFTLDGGAIRNSTSSALALNAARGITLGAGGGTLIGSSGGLTINGVISGSAGGKLTIALKDSVADSSTFGTVTLAANNTYNGATQIEQGMTLKIPNFSALGVATVAPEKLVLNGGTLRFDASMNWTDRNFTLTEKGGSIDASGTADMWFQSTDPIVMTGVGPRTLTLTGSSTNVNALALRITDQGTNPTTLRKNFTGTWLLTNPANSYSGNTDILTGRLLLGAAAGVIPDGSLVTLAKFDATLDLNAANETVRSVSGVGIVALGGKTLTVNNPQGESLDGAAQITGTGTGRLVKNGSGAWKLSPASSTYGGGFVLNSGTLGVGTPAALGTGTFEINDSVTFANTSSSGLNFTNAVTLRGDLTIDDSFTATPGQVSWGTSGTNKWTITGGTRKLTVDRATLGYQMTINQVIGQDAAGRGFIKAGNGTLSLTALNTYTGDTGVQEGALNISTAYLADGADVHLTSSGKLGLNFTGQDRIDSLFIDGIAQAIGTWGSPTSSATYKSNLFTGTGMLLVSALPPGVPGDFNNDSKVDAADYVVWRKRVGSTSALPNDNSLGVPIGTMHYDLWRAHFGQTPGAGSSASDRNESLASVPEPATALLIMAACGCLSAAYRIRKVGPRLCRGFDCV